MSRRDWYIAAVLWLLSCGAALLQLWPATSFGFVYDDYHFVRPYDPTEVLQAFHGTWDRAGIEPAFYRPLTVALYAGRFEIFGLNERAYHTASIIAFAVVGGLIASLVWRVTGRLATGVWVALFWTVHPNAPISLSVWITNQMHLAQTVVIVLSFWVWWRIKAADWQAWVPLLLGGAVAFLIKEDGILLLPTIVIAHELYRFLCDDTVPHVSVAFLVSAALMLAGLLVLRRDVLGGIGGYGAMLTREQMIANLMKGPSQTLFLRPSGSWSAEVQSWGMTAVLAAGVILGWARGERRHLFLVGLGVLMVVLFDLPFALVTKREQYYALTLGSVIAFGACADILTRWPRPRVRLLTMLPLLVVLATMSERAAAAMDLYAPLSESTLSTDRLVSSWAAVPFEIRQWLLRKMATHHASTLSRDLPYIVYGAYDVERDPRGKSFRWIGARTWIYTSVKASSLRFKLRATGGERPVRPFLITVTDSRRQASNVRLEPGQEQELAISLPGWTRMPQDMQPVQIEVDHTWTPGPHDPRQLGVIVSDIAIVEDGVERNAP